MTDDLILPFCQSLSSLCTNIQSNTTPLKDLVQGRPIPLDSASSTFLHNLNRRVASVSTDLDFLESMAFGTVSFEELLGNCNELYKENERVLVEIKNRFGCILLDDETDGEEEEIQEWRTPVGVDKRYFVKGFDGNSVCEETLHLRKLGLSDVCIATLASEATDDFSTPEIRSSRKPMFYHEQVNDINTAYQPTTEVMSLPKVQTGDGIKSVGDSNKKVLSILKKDYEKLPSFMKVVASWEDLNVAVEKINSALCHQVKPKEGNFFYQDELESFGLGSKTRSYLLLLVRMEQLVVETVGGSIIYRIL